jgi:DNA-binding transcriptional regulator GbsR (MarR family)
MDGIPPDSDRELALLLAEAACWQKELAETQERIEKVQEELSHAQRQAEASAKAMMMATERLLRDWRHVRRLHNP